MKVIVEDVSSVKKVLHIEVPEEDVTSELDAAYREVRKTAKVKGFRPGKAPRGVLERLYGKDIGADVAGRLIQSSFADAISQNELNVVGQPQIDPPALKKAAAYVYDATVEIRPEIDNVDFKGIELKKTAYLASDEEVETQLKMLQKNLARLEPIDAERPVAEGDFALIDYEGFKDGKPFEETQKTENFTLKLGDGKIDNTFDEQLVGMAPGDEKEIVVTFAADNPNSKLADQTISFQVKLNEIRKEILPQIDDELAKMVGEYDSLGALKDKIAENLQEGYDKRSEQELNEQIYTALLEKTEFEVPDTLVQFELEGIINEAERSFAAQNISMEDAGLTREGIAERYRETAVKQVKRHLILGKIIDQEKLELSDEELQEGISDMAKVYRQPAEGIRSYYDANPDKLEFFKHTLLEKKAIKLIIDSGKVETVKPETESPETGSEDATDAGSDEDQPAE